MMTNEVATLTTKGIVYENVNIHEVFDELIGAGARYQQIDAALMEDDRVSFTFAWMHFKMSMDMFWYLMNKQASIYFTLDGMRKETLAEL